VARHPFHPVTPPDLQRLLGIATGLAVKQPGPMVEVREVEHELGSLPSTTPGWEDLLYVVSMYEPGGGAYMFDEAALPRAVVEILHDLGRHDFCTH
jgi:hypothetical protein